MSERIVASPLTDACVEVLKRAEHACLGISPFNSYFSVERIRALAAWAYGRFARVDFFVPDAASAYTLEALGYPAEKAAWKARRQGQYTRNRIRSALETLGVDEGAGLVWGWAELEARPAFAHLHAQGLRLYEQDTKFRDACREASAWVLAGKLPEGGRTR
ncbi:tRNA-dependent cyclodipeptide synthase [Streptomyces sp. CdTB01]|uniref:tRNA-dependent cyclodipeptide synthase n=1 Tax=Streptomyces sp. CdTB01 TaxID=1725411 RepID=UPI000A5548DE|nr:tRNA-dependent cyclodipeptide synthase [Streptomyces sp. CdTB01]